VSAAAPPNRPISTDFWVVRHLPTPVTGALEPTPDWKGGNQAPPGGVIGRLLTWPAGFSYPRHTTPSLDFIVIVSGALELILDTESKVLNAGDVAIQRGTAHAWRLSGSAPCTFVGIMLAAQVRAMPFKSQAQRRKFAQLLVEGKISRDTYEEWNRETGSKRLPDHVKRKKTARKRKTAKKR
jgi:quercetin dioxygenase-like cupin family protein